MKSARVEFERVSPVFAVRDLEAAMARYRKLGFDAAPHAEPVYAFLRRGGVEIHLALVKDFDPEANTSACYLYVSDADALFAAWESARPDGRLIPPADTPYRLREFAYVDPDGNLLRIGSPTSGTSA
jgi:hypothetical protein